MNDLTFQNNEFGLFKSSQYVSLRDPHPITTPSWNNHIQTEKLRKANWLRHHETSRQSHQIYPH